MSDKRVLISYYSFSGNTRAAAEKILSITGGDMFEIKLVKDYPTDYNTVVNQAKTEKQNDIRPELVDSGNIGNYDVIFVGTPVWWYTMATPVKTFLTGHNFEGKVIIPFCTHGGGGESSTYNDINKFALNAEVLKGYTSYEDSANVEEIKNWLETLKI